MEELTEKNIDELIYEALVKAIRHDLNFDDEEEFQEYIDNLKYDYTNDVNEVNELYGLNLKGMEDYEFKNHFDKGSWLVYEGYFIRFGYGR